MQDLGLFLVITKFFAKFAPMLKLAVIGLGNRAGKYLRCVTERSGEVKICAVVEPDRCRLAKALSDPVLRDAALFDSAEDFFGSAPELDAVIVASPDRTHYDYAIRSIRNGWHVLLEKPAATQTGECRELAEEAAARGVVVAVCYVLRFHPFYNKLKEVSDSCGLGALRSIRYDLYVGIDRMTHTYVRGPWSRCEDSSPIILSKASHDVDMLCYLTGSRIVSVSSESALSFYNPDNAPEGAAKRCVDCPLENTCRYSAVDLYARRKDWICGFTDVEEELRQGPYGRCAFFCDNDVADRQEVDFVFENGVRAHLNLDGVIEKDGREICFRFEKGEVTAREYVIEVRSEGVLKEIFDMSGLAGQPLHCGADSALALAFLEAVRTGNREVLRGVDIAEAVHSHYICLETNNR